MLLEPLPQDFSVCRLEKEHPQLLDGDFIFFAKTDDEVSLVCETRLAPPDAEQAEHGWRALRAGLPPDALPIIADESVQGVASVLPLAGLADGVNIKLAKCGGLRAARQMIALARACGMQVMIGCMVESSVAVTAAAHLAPLADYADLDGNLLVTNDPYRGVRLEAGRLILPDAPGLGVSRHAA